MWYIGSMGYIVYFYPPFGAFLMEMYCIHYISQNAR